MQIIKIAPYENGGRPPIQTWDKPTPPAGYAIVRCDTADFYRFRGFVDIVVSDGVCSQIIGDQAALDAYLAEHPDQPDPEPEPSTEDILNTLLGTE